MSAAPRVHRGLSDRSPTSRAATTRWVMADTAGSMGRHAWPLVLLLAGLFAVRCAAIAGSGAGLHVDEAQYWEWSHRLEWGYSTKPPLIAVLLAASTAVAGSGLLGLRWLPMLCWLGASFFLWRLGCDMRRPRAGLFAAVLLAGTPASSLLGLVATTDAPLMLCWSAAMWCTWQALRSQRRAVVWWAAAGLLLGLGLNAKYTMAALPLGWAVLAWQLRGRGIASGAVLGTLVGAVMLLPHLMWNSERGWPTFEHTVLITAGTAKVAGPAGLLEFAAGQLLLAGPVVCIGWLVWRRLRTRVDQGDALRRRFAMAFVGPLWLLAAVVSVRAPVQLNWTAPVLLGLCLAAGLVAERADAGPRALCVAALLSAGLSLGVSLGGDLQRLLPAGWQRPGLHWDAWQRMRGWDSQFAHLRAVVDDYRALPVVGTRRDLIAHATYAWRDTGRRIHAWTADDRPSYDAQRTLAWRAPMVGHDILLLTDGEPTPAQRQAYPSTRLLAYSEYGRRRIELWLASNRDAGASP